MDSLMPEAGIPKIRQTKLNIKNPALHVSPGNNGYTKHSVCTRAHYIMHTRRNPCKQAENRLHNRLNVAHLTS